MQHLILLQVLRTKRILVLLVLPWMHKLHLKTEGTLPRMHCFRAERVALFSWSMPLKRSKSPWVASMRRPA